MIISVYSCSKKDSIYEPSEKINPYQLYKEGLNAFDRTDFFYANKKFSEAELNFETVELAAKSSLMASFSLYAINFYNDAEEGLNRFLKTYPSDKNVIYAHYLIAIIHFEKMVDEKKDLGPLLEAKNKIDFFTKKYPRSDYAMDLKFKRELIQNQLAAKEIYIAKYYINIKKWVPAINRLKVIIDEYDKTVFIEEALHRLVEIHYHLGLEKEAKKYVTILGYNYNSSEWYEQSYKILNKNYEIKNKNKTVKKKKNLFKKILDVIK
jgi:outer membrane protein assembly factor BamD